MTGNEPPRGGFPFDPFPSEPEPEKLGREPSLLLLFCMYTVSPPLAGTYYGDNVYQRKRGEEKENKYRRFFAGAIGFSVGGLINILLDSVLYNQNQRTIYEGEAQKVVIQQIIDPEIKSLSPQIEMFLSSVTTIHAVNYARGHAPYTNVIISPSDQEECRYSIEGHLNLEELTAQTLPLPTVHIVGKQIIEPELIAYVNAHCLQMWNIEKQQFSASSL